MKYEIDDVINVVIKTVGEAAIDIDNAADSIGKSEFIARKRIKENAEEIFTCIGWLVKEETKRLKKLKKTFRKKTEVEA